MGPRQRQGRSRSKTHALPIILLSFLGFLLIAGVAFGIGMVGNVNRWLSDLPDYTDANAYLVSEPTEIVDCNGNKIASFYTQNRKSITKDEVSPYVLQGTVDVEDERFYEHGGIDLWGIARAAVATLGGGHEGASTITQQLVRNTILQEEQFDSTIERKVREAYIAVKMEDMYSKDEILMMYLNTIYYGHGAYGIEAAAETYLSKSAADLTLSEAALLIGLPNSPSQYDPTVNPDLALSRRNKVLDNMLRLGHITQEEHDAAQAEPITLNVTEISGSGVDVYSQPYFVSYVKQLLEQEFSTDVLFKGGLTVKTTIDPTMQQVAENAVREQLDTLSLDGLDMGMVVVDPKTGYIKCMVGGYDYNADENHVNHATAKRPVGSTFKAFTLATAIQNGMNPNVTLNCNSPLKAKGTTTEVQNYANQSYGNITLKQATAYSSNTGYIQVAEAVGNSKIISLVKKLGIDPAKDNIEDVPVMTLGTGSISPLEMAAAYATFANGGYYRQPIAITEIDSRTGSVLYQHTDNPSQVLTQGEAGVMPLGADYVKAARKLCDEHKALLIIDEVQTGIGRTGAWFAFQREDLSGGVTPDIVTFAKGVGGGFPMGGMISFGAELSALFTPGSHGSTFAGNPLGASAALATLGVIEEDNLVDNAEERGKQLRDGIASCGNPLFVSVRGRGLLDAIELAHPCSHAAMNWALEHGLIVNAVAPNALRLAPPLVITAQDVDQAVSILAKIPSDLPND